MRQLMSVEDYLALPEEKPYLEYVNGEVCAKPMPDWIHMQIAAFLIRRLNAYTDAYGGFAGWEGRTGFDDPDQQRFYLPDVQYYRNGLPRARPLPPPTLSIEVRSEGQSLSWLWESAAISALTARRLPGLSIRSGGWSKCSKATATAPHSARLTRSSRPRSPASSCLSPTSSRSSRTEEARSQLVVAEPARGTGHGAPST